MNFLKAYFLGIVSIIALVSVVVLSFGLPGTIVSDGDGWLYSRWMSDEQATNYITWYIDNWPDKHHDYLESRGGCVVDYNSTIIRAAQLDACDTLGKQKAHLTFHLDTILNGEYNGEKGVYDERRSVKTVVTLD